VFFLSPSGTTTPSYWAFSVHLQVDPALPRLCGPCCWPHCQCFDRACNGLYSFLRSSTAYLILNFWLYNPNPLRYWSNASDGFLHSGLGVLLVICICTPFSLRQPYYHGHRRSTRTLHQPRRRHHVRGGRLPTLGLGDGRITGTRTVHLR
jgi:hypothetical protein